MKRSKIFLSSGIFPWFTLSKITNFAKENSFDGIELLPTRQIIKNFENDYQTNPLVFKSIKGIHHNWRLDIGQDKKYGINMLNSLVFMLIRLTFFPSVSKSRTFLQYLSKTIDCPEKIHNISSKWTKDNNKKGFKGGVSCEIMDITITPQALKEWLTHANHFIVVDTRDDQSSLWAKKYGFKDWKQFWMWIGLQKIKSIQLTLIGTSTIKKILDHKKTLAEEQLIWMNKNKWEGNVTVEVNPISILLSNKFKLKEGLSEISFFTRQTLIHGKKWSY